MRLSARALRPLTKECIPSHHSHIFSWPGLSLTQASLRVGVGNCDRHVGKCDTSCYFHFNKLKIHTAPLNDELNRLLSDSS